MIIPYDDDTALLMILWWTYPFIEEKREEEKRQSVFPILLAFPAKYYSSIMSLMSVDDEHWPSILDIRMAQIPVLLMMIFPISIILMIIPDGIVIIAMLLTLSGDVWYY